VCHGGQGVVQWSREWSRKLTSFATNIREGGGWGQYLAGSRMQGAKGDRMRGQGFPPEVIMRGTMMDFPLVLPVLLERAGKLFPKVEILSRKPDKSVVHANYGLFYRRARQLGEVLNGLGLRRGDRVASLMWNHAAHLEAFFGVSCAGGILHTLNPRLHPHEIAAIANHAGDRFLIIDDTLLPLLEKFRRDVHFERVIVVPYCGAAAPAESLNYEDVLASAKGEFPYPEMEETAGGRGAAAGSAGERSGTAGVSSTKVCEMAIAGRVCVRRGDSPDERGQVQKDRAAATVCKLEVGGVETV